jgi:hypothetical protein
LDTAAAEGGSMRFIYLAAFTVVSIFLGTIGHIEIRDMYIGMTMFLAAEYIECAIERKK